MIHRPEPYTSISIDDLLDGSPNTASNACNVVSCEQVLEHLSDSTEAIPAFKRIAEPRGLVSVGRLSSFRRWPPRATLISGRR